MTDTPQPVVAPHGSWPSALTAEMAAAGAVRFDGVRVAQLTDGTVRVRWQESRPAERGRGALCEWVGALGATDGSSPRDLGPAATSARSAVSGRAVGRRSGGTAAKVRRCGRRRWG